MWFLGKKRGLFEMFVIGWVTLPGLILATLYVGQRAEMNQMRYKIDELIQICRIDSAEHI